MEPFISHGKANRISYQGVSVTSIDGDFAEDEIPELINIQDNGDSDGSGDELIVQNTQGQVDKATFHLETAYTDCSSLVYNIDDKGVILHPEVVARQSAERK